MTQKTQPPITQWVSDLRDQCVHADIQFFFKQWGEWCPQSVMSTDKSAEKAIYMDVTGDTRSARYGTQRGSVIMHRVGKKKAGRLLDGREWNETPN